MDYLYLIEIALEIGNIYKVGVAKNVQGRMTHMIRQTNRPCRLIAKWGFTGKFGDCLKNYRIENQVHAYLSDHQFAMWEHFPEFAGKTECFDVSLAKALSACALGMRWTESNPRPIKQGYVITYKGFIKPIPYLNRHD